MLGSWAMKNIPCFPPPLVDYIELALADSSSWKKLMLLLVDSPSYLVMLGFGKLSMCDSIARVGIVLILFFCFLWLKILVTTINKFVTEL